jgi:hypothetical protein
MAELPEDTPPLPCHEKAKFTSEGQARAAAALELFRHGTKLKAYNCRYCGLWHLSSNY